MPRLAFTPRVEGDLRLQPQLQPALAIVAVLVLWLFLPPRFVWGPVWLLPALEVALLVPTVVASPFRAPGESPWVRRAMVVLIALIGAANLSSLVLLVRFLLDHGSASGHDLLGSAAGIWLTSVATFSLWFWELDRGGPAARAHTRHERNPDFLFPQMDTPEAAAPGWTPAYFDYLYVAFTNASAFSPTDALPLTRVAKLVMLSQSLACLVTVAIVAARAVNILG